MRKFSETDILEVLRSRIGKTRGKTTATELAKELNVNYTVLTDVLYGIKKPTTKIIEALGFKKITKTEVYFIKKKSANDAEGEKQ